MAKQAHGEPSRFSTLQSPNSSQWREKSIASNSAMGAKKSKTVMIPYEVYSQSMEDPSFKQLTFQCCITLGKAPVPCDNKIQSESSMKNQLLGIKHPLVSLSRCLRETIKEKVFFYATEEMPNSQNSFMAKRWFTTGLHEVDYNMEHKVTNMAQKEDGCRMVIFYICKDDKKYQYENHANKGHALIREQRIKDDFKMIYLEKEPLLIGPGSIYFFYTASIASFEIKHCPIPTIPPFKSEPDCVLIEISPEHESQSVTTSPPILKPRKQDVIHPLNLTIDSPTKQKQVNPLNLTSDSPTKQKQVNPLNMASSPLRATDPSLVWDTKGGNLKTKKRKLSVETHTVIKQESGRIEELEQELDKAREEIRTLKTVMRKHLENLVGIQKDFTELSKNKINDSN